ncbi:MAG: hypothetical protein LBN23_05770, partial [Paludibacter sp.]|nr:hypothetical protein [Paludibacter sp.]
MLRTLFTALIALVSTLLSAQQYKALDASNPVAFDGKTIIYNGKTIPLNDKTFFVDGQLPDETVAKYKFVFNSFNEAVKNLKDGDEKQPMTVYIAPYVYWIDNPDDPAIRAPQGDDRAPIGLHVNCNYLKVIGLTKNPVNVSLAANRGQSHGSKGNFTTFQFTGNHLYFENITFGNYCNVDLEFPLKPALNRPKRSSSITQAQLAFVSGDCIEAHNCRFISRLNTCNLIGGKRTLFNNCHMECTDDAMASGVYLNCSFDFYSSKPWGSTRGTGAVLLNCDFNIIQGARQYFTKVQGPVTAIDCRYTANSDVYIGWNQDPTDDFRGYQHNVRLNGKPIVINADKPQVTVDITDKPLADAYYFDYQGKRVYNVYNLLSGNDGWDPLKMKATVTDAEKQHNKTFRNLPTFLQLKPRNATVETGVTTANLQTELLLFSGENIKNNTKYNWQIIKNQKFAEITPNNETCRVEGKNNEDEAQRVI